MSKLLAGTGADRGLSLWGINLKLHTCKTTNRKIKELSVQQKKKSDAQIK